MRVEWDNTKRLANIRKHGIDFVAGAVVRKGLKPVPPKRQVTLRLDADVLEWFKGIAQK